VRSIAGTLDLYSASFLAARESARTLDLARSLEG
jgi:hypothetical protein